MITHYSCDARAHLMRLPCTATLTLSREQHLEVVDRMSVHEASLMEHYFCVLCFYWKQKKAVCSQRQGQIEGPISHVTNEFGKLSLKAHSC